MDSNFHVIEHECDHHGSFIEALIPIITITSSIVSID